MSRFQGPLLTVVALLVAGTGPASAAVTDLGTGAGARVAVGEDGKGHVAWAIDPAGAERSYATYCRVPAGGGACEVTQRLDFPNVGEDTKFSSPASVVVRGSTVTVFSSCYLCGPGANSATDRMVKWESADGGTTWSAPTAPVEIHRGGTQGDTGQSLLLGTGPSSIFVFASPARVRAGTEPFVTDSTSPLNTGGFDYSAAIAAVPGGTKLVTARDDLSDAQFNVFTDPDGDPISADEIENVANWTAPQTLTGTGGGQNTALAGGITHPVLTYVENTNSVANVLMARQFNPTTTGLSEPVAISAAATPIYGTGSSQTPAGRTDVVWEQGDGFRLLYASSADGGATWTAPQRLRTGRALNPEVAANTAGAGFALFNSSPGTGTVSIVPLSDAGPDQDPPPTTTTPTTPGGGTPPPTTVPVFTPGGPSGLPSTSSGSASGGTYTFVGPKTCVPRGNRFSVTLRVKKQKRKGNLFVKVTKVDFYIGTRKVKTDRKAPFRQTLTATATAARGGTIRVRARAFIKVRKTKRVPKKSVFLRIRICS